MNPAATSIGHTHKSRIAIISYWLGIVSSGALLTLGFNHHRLYSYLSAISLLSIAKYITSSLAGITSVNCN